ncbi:MAG: CAP domain-containing protein [Clostridiales bacterium]|nr:CAP domain-containing protein [Clostridiales bacterium]
MTHFEYEVFMLTNEERRKHGLAALAWNDALAKAAQGHSRDLATSNTFSHSGSDGSAPEQRLHRASASIRFLGENISGGRNSPGAAINDWMASAGHRANILNMDAVYLGVGVVYLETSRFKFYVVQVFGS